MTSSSSRLGSLDPLFLSREKSLTGNSTGTATRRKVEWSSPVSYLSVIILSIGLKLYLL